jgi:sulfate/thiosulfate transport system permease protein
MSKFRFREPSIIPGFRVTFGFTLFWLFVIVIIPIVGIYYRTFELDWAGFVSIVTGPRFLAAMRLSFGASLLAALFNVFIGVLVAWVLVRRSALRASDRSGRHFAYGHLRSKRLGRQPFRAV